MLQLARSTPFGMVLGLLSHAACSAPDWPVVAESTSGGESNGVETPASGAGDGSGPASDPSRTPRPSAAGGVGQEGNAPISGGVSNLGGEADAGSARPVGVDAGGVPSDASIEPPSPPGDTAEPDDTPEPEPEPEPPCVGVPLAGSCWYLGDAGLACDDVCASHGGFAPDAAGIVGTPAQGGSVEGCTAVLEALGALSAPVAAGFREDGLGLGCHVFANATPPAAWWLSAPDLSPAASGIAVRVACGCVR